MSIESVIPSSSFQIKFIKYIPWLLDSGSYTSTYKFALLMSLVDVAIESGIQDDSEYFVSYEYLAEHFIKLYWNQVLPYNSQQVNDSVILSQIGKGRRTVIVTAIAELQTKQTNLNVIKIEYPEAYLKLVKKVSNVIKNNPALYLQSPESNNQKFLYQYDKTSKGIILNSGIVYCFSYFSSIIYKLCQYHWTQYIRNNMNNHHLFNNEQDLQQFLFGKTRQTLSSLVPLFKDIQENQCFYCQKPLKDEFEVDHFIPWSKYHSDTSHNFVLADPKCNNSKSGYLADVSFYEKWLARNQQFGLKIYDYGSDRGFVSNQDISERVSQWAYQMAIENNDLVWTPPKKLEVISKLKTSIVLY